MLDLTIKTRISIKKARSPKMSKMFWVTDGHLLQTPEERLLEYPGLQSLHMMPSYPSAHDPV